MVEIFLIEQNNEFVKVRGVPEQDESKSFIIVVDAKNRKIIENEYEMNNHIAHTAFKVYREYKKNKKIPSHMMVIWC